MLNILKRFIKMQTTDRLPNDGVSYSVFSIRSHSWLIGGIVVLALILTLFFPKGKSFEFADVREGMVYTGEDIIAPFTFPVNKSAEEYNRDVEQARKSIVPVFVVDETIAKTRLNDLATFLQRIKLLLKSKVTTIEEVKALYNRTGIVISDEDVNLLLNGFSSSTTTVKTNNIGPRVKKFDQIAQIILKLVGERYDSGILDVEKSGLLENTSVISVTKNGISEQESLQFYEDVIEVSNTLLEKLRANEKLGEHEIKIAYAIGQSFLQPNILYDQEATEALIQDAIANVPLAKDQVLADEKIIGSHEVPTKEQIEILNSLAVAKAERGEMEGALSSTLPNIGKFMLVLTLLSVLALYLYQERRDVFNDRKKLLLIGLNLFIIAAFTYIANYFGQSAYIIPFATLAIIITIFFDARVSFIIAVVAALLVGALRGNEYSITFISLVVSAVAIQTVRKVRTRNWIIRSGLVVTAAYIVSIFIIDLVTYIEFGDTLRNWGIGALNGFLSPALAYLLIIIFESVFDLTTDMTLLELSDFNHPLLRQLHFEAPGTYHHSYLVGLLAESATEALGGNALLARVGAYYHDIGKLEKPEYFVENQTRGRNPQEKLAPSMSALVLANHVRRGAEMARENGLPREIEDFIYQHHGTSLMSFFHQKALEQNPAETVSENEFRYPGPRPQTRETAIVMLADAVEAASRTLKDPTPGRIKNLVETIIDERFKSGELDDSPLTLSDLSQISLAFQKILNGRFHGRIDYPDNHKFNRPESTDAKKT